MNINRTTGFVSIDITAGKVHTYNNGNQITKIYTFNSATTLRLPENSTYFGFVSSGEVELKSNSRERTLEKGDFFSNAGPIRVKSNGLGIIIAHRNYEGFNVFGGPLEEKGKLRYIDGCTDTLLVPPVRKGDPCLNHLHFPKNITQTPHTHPSVRIGMIYRGRGECILSNQTIPLTPNMAFVINTNALHSFNTQDSSMDVIAYHPDSDVGMEDSNHPMINRTIIDGVSAGQK